jgi:hypothetical protein
MRAFIAMQDSVGGIDRRNEDASKLGLIERAGEILSICRQAADAAYDYERLKSMSDAELARRGLKRSELPRAVFDKLTQKS